MGQHSDNTEIEQERNDYEEWLASVQTDDDYMPWHAIKKGHLGEPVLNFCLEESKKYYSWSAIHPGTKVRNQVCLSVSD